MSNVSRSEKELQQHFFKNANFQVHWAEQKIVRDEWNFLWTNELYQIQNHRIYLIADGSAKVTLRNGGEPVTLLADHLYFFPAFSIQKTECPNVCHQAFVHFSTDNLYLNTIGFMPEYFCVPVASLEEKRHLLFLRDTIEANYRKTNDLESMMRTDGCLRYLLSYFFRGFAEWNLKMSRFHDVLEYVNENLHLPITVRDLAGIKNFNVVYFSNLFSKYFGVSPKQYLINQRIALAQSLLIQTELSVKEICYNVGFQTESYFIRKFSKMLGLTPTQYRKSLLNAEPSPLSPLT